MQGSSKVIATEVNSRDISLAIGSCDFDSVDNQSFILNAMQVNFSLDNKSKLSDPIGQVGDNLSVDFTSSDEQETRSIRDAKMKIFVNFNFFMILFTFNLKFN